MADLVSVPDSGAGSGSSTATFGEGIGQIFAMPASGQVDTSAAESDSGVDVYDSGLDGHPSQPRGVRRRAPQKKKRRGLDHDHRPPPPLAMVLQLSRRRGLRHREDLLNKVRQAVVHVVFEEDLTPGARLSQSAVYLI